MIGCLLDHWRYTWGDIWNPLGSVRKAPADLFTALYDGAYDFLRKPPDYKEFENIENDPGYAKQEFQRIEAEDFGSEATVIGFMEAAFQKIRDFDIKGYARLYKNLVNRFIEKYNLRYRIDTPFRLRLLLPGVFAGLYQDLGRLSHSNVHLTELMHDFEYCFGTYARTKETNDLKTCISKASMYAEGVAANTAGQVGTLGSLCDCLGFGPMQRFGNPSRDSMGFALTTLASATPAIPLPK